MPVGPPAGGPADGCRDELSPHGRGMSHYPAWNHADRRLLVLTPRDYAANPHRFGHDPKLTFLVPPDGTTQAARAALLQHQLVVVWRTTQLSGAQLARRYGMSRSVWSRTATGNRWAGQLLLTALAEAARQRPPHTTQHTNGGTSP